jgi:hypothetical protein
MQTDNFSLTCFPWQVFYLMLVMLFWVYIHTGQAWKICLPNVARHIFQACPVWIYTQSQSNISYITSIVFTWVHCTNTEKIKFFICSCVRQNFDNFSLPRSLVPKLIMPVFEQGKFVRVYDLQGNLDKCIQEILLYGFGKQKVALT